MVQYNNQWWQQPAPKRKKKIAATSDSEWGASKPAALMGAGGGPGGVPQQAAMKPSSSPWAGTPYQGAPAPKPPAPNAGAPYTPGQLGSYQPENLLGFQPGGDLTSPYTESGLLPAGSEAEQRAIFGPAAELFPTGRPIQGRDIAGLTLGLNMQNQEQALLDRARGVEALDYARGLVGGSPESILAAELATSGAQGLTGPYSDQEVEARRQGIISGGRAANEAAKQGLTADFAQRNISGAMPAFETAMLDQAGRAQTASQLSGFAEEVAAARQAAQQSSLAQLGQLGAYGETLETDLFRDIAEAYTNTDRAPFDLSGLIEPAPYGMGIVGSTATYVQPQRDPWTEFYLNNPELRNTGYLR